MCTGSFFRDRRTLRDIDAFGCSPITKKEQKHGDKNDAHELPAGDSFTWYSCSLWAVLRQTRWGLLNNIVVVIVAIVGKSHGVGGSTVVSASRKDEPWMGQKVCPVSGARLGSMGQPVPVDTGIGARQPSFMGKLIGRKATAGVVIYVCCQDCAAKVKKNPGTYFVKVLAEVNAWSHEIADTNVSEVNDPTTRR